MKQDLLAEMRLGRQLSLKKQLFLILQLSVPAVLAQLSSIIMSYIDAAMVGQLGAEDSASIGLVASSTWLVCGLCFAAATGFNVQVAHLVGANNFKKARNLLKNSIVHTGIFSIFVTVICLFISPYVPFWLGGSEEISHNAWVYFFVFALSLPIIQMNNLAAGMLQCSGEMKIPSALQILMAVLNVFLNYFFIFVLKFGVFGAALATLIARGITTILLLYFLLFKSEILKFRKDEKIYFEKTYLTEAWKIGLPVAFEQIIMSGGQVAFTRIVAPLGKIQLAANSFAITAESICYMPAYGLAAASTTLCGQAFGGNQKELTYRLGWLTSFLGIIIMVIAGALMFVFAPQMIGFLSPDEKIRKIGARILRIEAFSEPFYGGSIVVTGALRGTGDTFVPSCMKFFSMWLVRIPLAIFLRGKFGLEGVWFAMSFELCVRGIIFFIRLSGKKWLKI